MKHLLIVYHSQSGATERLAQAAAKGVRQESDVELRLLRAAEADTRDLLWADAVLFGSPENFGYLSGGLSDFLARTFYPLQGRQRSWPYGVFISAGNDGRGALRHLERIVGGAGRGAAHRARRGRGGKPDALRGAGADLGGGAGHGYFLGRALFRNAQIAA